MEFIVAWLLEVIIIAFICGVISAVVAVNKGRSGVGWFVIGNLLGPLGLVLSLVVSKNQQAVEQAAIATGDMRKCPFCAELIKSEASVCRHCGREIKDAPRSSPEQAHHIKKLVSLFTSGQPISSEQFKAIVDAAATNPEIAQSANRVNGDTLLHFAARKNFVDEAEKLISFGASPSAGDGSGRKPYQVASDPKLAELLRGHNQAA